jgi:carboxylesterase type B
MWTLLLNWLLCLNLCQVVATTDCNNAPTVTIKAGVVIGRTTSLPAALAPVNQFLGIPFAKSPPERFSPPQPALRFSKPIHATKWKPACMQQFRCTCIEEVPDTCH